LTALRKEFEIKIFPDEGHGLSTQEVFVASLGFFKRKLIADSPKR